MQDDATIRYRSCSWGKTAALLFAQYIGLATMCFPAAYSELGWFSGILATFLVAALCLYTSLTLWRFCLRHPHVRDICDIGILLFGEKAWVRWATAIMFVANNIVSHDWKTIYRPSDVDLADQFVFFLWWKAAKSLTRCCCSLSWYAF